MDGTFRKDISPGVEVVIVEKLDQGTGRSTRGVVKEILTSAAVHPRGMKVRLMTGEVGRVQYIEPYEFVCLDSRVLQEEARALSTIDTIDLPG